MCFHQQQLLLLQSWVSPSHFCSKGRHRLAAATRGRVRFYLLRLAFAWQQDAIDFFCSNCFSVFREPNVSFFSSRADFLLRLFSVTFFACSKILVWPFPKARPYSLSIPHFSSFFLLLSHPWYVLHFPLHSFFLSIFAFHHCLLLRLYLLGFFIGYFSLYRGTLIRSNLIFSLSFFHSSLFLLLSLSALFCLFLFSFFHIILFHILKQT